MSVNLYMVGTAGCGKSTLTKEFKVWMDMNGFQGVTINLDPGAEQLPYEPDIDIRDWISLREVMQEYGLGPNGAQIVCADMIAFKAHEIRELMDTYDCHYFLIDTPGQIELFAFRRSSREIVDVLGGKNSLLMFLFDPILSKQPSGFVSLLLMAITTQLRFDVPYFPIISKSDLLSYEELDMISGWAEDLSSLEYVLRESTTISSNASVELIKSLHEIYSEGQQIIPVSSDQATGLEDIYTEVQSIFYGCDDLESY